MCDDTLYVLVWDLPIQEHLLKLVHLIVILHTSF